MGTVWILSYYKSAEHVGQADKGLHTVHAELAHARAFRDRNADAKARAGFRVWVISEARTLAYQSGEV